MSESMVRYEATEEEISLIEDFDEIGYGEIYNPMHIPGPTRVVQIGEKTRKFFHALRELKRVSRLIIHDGEPAAMEYRGTTANGRKCLKKMKF